MITQVPAIVTKLGIMKEPEERSIISNGEINEHHSPYSHRIISVILRWKNQLENRVLQSHMTRVTCRLARLRKWEPNVSPKIPTVIPLFPLQF